MTAGGLLLLPTSLGTFSSLHILSLHEDTFLPFFHVLIHLSATRQSQEV